MNVTLAVIVVLAVYFVACFLVVFPPNFSFLRKLKREKGENKTRNKKDKVKEEKLPLW